MSRKLGLLCVALAMFSIAGGHFAVLQGVAWAQMFARYSQRTGSVLAGAEQTFDGHHPCDLCRAIQAVKSGGPSQQPAAPAKSDVAKVKALLAAAVPPAGERIRTAAAYFPAEVRGGPSRTNAPPTPPPRQRGTLVA